MARIVRLLIFFSFTNPSLPETYTLSLHDALPISSLSRTTSITFVLAPVIEIFRAHGFRAIALLQPLDIESYGSKSVRDRKSTRLNSSHRCISYAVLCLKKKIKIGGVLSSTFIRLT